MSRRSLIDPNLQYTQQHINPGAQPYDNTPGVMRVFAPDNSFPRFGSYQTSPTTFSRKSDWLGAYTPDPVYSGANSVTYIPSGSENVDDYAARLSQHRGAINQKALTGHARTTRAMMEKYFRNELDLASQYQWWGAYDVENDYLPY